jgi:hypothetical protein
VQDLAFVGGMARGIGRVVVLRALEKVDGRVSGSGHDESCWDRDLENRGECLLGRLSPLRESIVWEEGI